MEATTWRRRALGSGQTALPGKTHSGAQENQTTWGVKTAWRSETGSGTIPPAAENVDLCAVRRFAQVEYMNLLKSVILVAGDETTTSRDEVTPTPLSKEATGKGATGEVTR